MKKIKSLFERQFENHKVVAVLDKVTVGNEWVLAGEGKATRKYDGTAVMIQNGDVYRRFDCKRGKTPPMGFIPCQEPDSITRHWPGWVKIDKHNPIGDEKFFVEGYTNTFGDIDANVEDATYELCGPKINNNPERLDKHILIKHGEDVLEIERNYESIKDFLKNNYIEGIVFHRGNGDMCKIKRVDFGFEWNGKTTKR